jgi:hypothetical protein
VRVFAVLVMVVRIFVRVFAVLVSLMCGRHLVVSLI